MRAGRAHEQTPALLDRTRTLPAGLVVTVTWFLILLILLLVAGVVVWQFHREREAAHSKLRRLNAELYKLGLVIQATDNLVVVTNPDGATEWVNDAFVRCSGIPLEQAVGHNPGRLLQGPDTDPETVARIRTAVAARESFVEEILNYSVEGRPYWVSIEAHPILGDRERFLGFIAIETDVTERRAIEESLRRATETATNLAQEKAAFLATMSHEIRTPLNAVLGVTALLIGTALDEEQTEYVATAQHSGRLLLGLVNDILDFSALESDRLELESRAFALPETLYGVQSMFGPQAAGRGLVLTLTMGAGVPAQLLGDENRIQQVLVNLVGNGLKFTHHGGVAVDVTRTEDTDGAWLRFAVSDTGIGIPADRHERLFLPFTQVDPSTTRQYGGSGLGLSICRLLAQRLGGTLTMTSTVGEGSVFLFTIPLQVPVEPARPVPDVSAEPAADLSGLRVLLAEDEAINRMVALRMLARLGVEADVAVDGIEVLERVEDRTYDVIFMDVHMPRMDGLAATRAVRARLPEGEGPVIVALTANALQGDRERMLAAGMDAYQSKPVTVEALRTTLAAVVAGRNGVPAV